MNLPFIKMEGLGNDFVLLDCLKGNIPADAGALARRLCERRHGIGADGMLLVCPGKVCDARMRIFNADGSEAQMCGNGIRCVALFLHRAGYPDEMEIATMAGVKRVRVSGEMVTVDMGAPVWEAESVPVRCETPVMLEADVDSGYGVLKVSAVSMGNPHGVVFTDHLIRYPVKRCGRALERHEIWPERANIEFVTVIDRHNITMRAWERGVGETKACGTGACAAAAVSVATGRADFPVEVRLPGGVLTIDSDAEGHIMMTGPARVSFEGNIQTL